MGVTVGGGGGGVVDVGLVGRAAGTGGGVCAFSFCEAEVDEDAVAGFGVVEEVGGFDVAVEDVVFVDGSEAAEEGAEVVPHLGDGHVAVVELWVCLLVMG